MMLTIQWIEGEFVQANLQTVSTRCLGQGLIHLPKQSYGESNRANHGGWKASFRWSITVVIVLDASISFVVPDRIRNTDEHADSYSQECKPANSLRPTSALLEYNGKSTKAHVQRACDLLASSAI